MGSTKINHWNAVRRRVSFFLKTKGIFFGKNMFLTFLRHAPLPRKPMGVSYKKWLLEQYNNGELKAFPIDKSRKTKKQRKEGRDAYLRYLDSPEWRKKREEVFLFHGRFCCKCKTNNRLQIHHLTYVNLFNEKMEDLMVLCKPCHIIEHGNGKKRKKVTI